MPENGFEARPRHEGAAAVIDLSGEVNRDAAGPLNEAYAEVSKNGSGSLLLNFTAVDYINSTGIAVIVSVLGKARQEGREVRVCGLTDHYRDIFEITKLSDFMAIFPDEQSALAGATDKEGD